MRAKYCLASVVGLGLVFSAASFGQSIIEYGHGVAKAGVAGAASGTGLAGIFTKMKDTSDDKDKNYRPSNTSPSVPTEDDLREEMRRPGEPANAPLKMTTSNGVVVSGVSPNWMGAAYRDPVREPVRVQSVEWSNPTEEQPVAAEQGSEGSAPVVTEQSGVPASAGTAPVEAAAHEQAGPGRVVSGDHAVGNSAGQAAGSGQGDGETYAEPLEPVTDAEVAGIRLGSRIEDVIRTLGRPTFSFTGIVGKGYTEKYVFKHGEEKITVFTWTGVVTSVQVS